MPTLLENITKKTTSMSDEIIASNMIASSKGLANAYLNATLVSSTPELRAIYSSNLSEVLAGEAVVTELAVKKGWEQPYNPPVQQLSDAYNKAKSVVGSGK